MHVVSVKAKISPTRNSKSAKEIQESFLFSITRNLKSIFCSLLPIYFFMLATSAVVPLISVEGNGYNVFSKNFVCFVASITL